MLNNIKYLFIVLLVGVCSGQIVPDTLVMKSGKTYLGTYYDKDSKHTEFKYQRSMDREKILNSNIKELRLGDKSKVVKVFNTPFLQKDSDVNVHLKNAGKHFNSFFERSMYALGFGIASTLWIIDGSNDPTLSIIFSLAGLYNNVIAIFEINNAGKELIKASRTMKMIEKDLNKEKPK
jgi:hypothetical protein